MNENHRQQITTRELRWDFGLEVPRQVPEFPGSSVRDRSLDPLVAAVNKPFPVGSPTTSGPSVTYSSEVRWLVFAVVIF